MMEFSSLKSLKARKQREIMNCGNCWSRPMEEA